MADTRTALYNLTKMDSVKVLEEVFQILRFETLDK